MPVIGEETFHAHARAWWDENGPFAALHHLMPLRMDWIHHSLTQAAAKDGGQISKGRAQRTLKRAHVLDVGCGGGLVAEPIARLGAHVTGLDALEENVTVARDHAALVGLDIAYRQGLLEEFKSPRTQKFDVITAFEVIEHVARPLDFLERVAVLLKPGGLFVLSTPDRTLWSRLMVVGAAEALGYVPPGTHDWEAFLTPDELKKAATFCDLAWLDGRGVGYNPISRTARLTDEMDAGLFSGAFRAGYVASFLRA